MLRFSVMVLAFTLALSHAGNVSAQQERIHTFHTEVKVGKDGVMTVTETIAVTAAHRDIKRGIYRDIPTRYGGDSLGLKARIPFQVKRILRNGSREAFHIDRRGGYDRIYIGDKDRFVPKGKHTYVIEYTTKQLRFFEEHDEVYWNATGNDWRFPIDKARATVVLPGDIPGDKITFEAYVGPLGSNNQDYVDIAVDKQTGAIHYDAEPRLPPGHGLTIVATFPKGHVPDTTQFNPVLLIALLTLGGMMFYFVATWLVIGLDPAAGTIFPRFQPPDGLTAAGVGFIHRMGFNNDCFAAAIISLGVKGYLQVTKKDEHYKLIRQKRAYDDLPDPEREVFKELLGPRSSIALKNTNHVEVSRARAELQAKLAKAHEGELFHPHRGWAWFGFLLAMFGCGLTIVANGGFSWVAGGLIAILLIAQLIYVRLIKKPTRQGRRTMDAIDGFKMYLETAEQDRLDHATSQLEHHARHHGGGERPEKTIELFERFLPYAVALDVANKWADQFEDLLSDAAADRGSRGHYAHWYRGPSRGFNYGAVAAGIGTSLSAAVASAASAPSSGSGSGGGGFSGGGGGGGGGGGW